MDLAEQAFEAEGEIAEDPVHVLLEALRCARDDLELVATCGGGSTSDGVQTGAGRRAEMRIDLALKLYEFRVKHGGSRSENSNARREAAAGGAS